MSDWRPDWEDPNAYPQPNELSAQEWGWEFLRRNEEYSMAYKTKALPVMTSCVGKPGRTSNGLALDPDEEHPAITEFQNYWRISAPVSPDINGPRAIRFVLPTQGVRIAQNLNTGGGTRPEDVAVVFDLTRPLPYQMRLALKVLRVKQRNLVKEGIVKLRKGKPQRSCFPEYIRLLDAREAGVGFRLIGETIYTALSKGPDAVETELRAQKYYSRALEWTARYDEIANLG